MNFERRHFLQVAAGATALANGLVTAKAQTYPAKPVRIVVGYPPGGFTDIHARLIGQWLSEQFDRSFVIENRAGGAGNIGAEAVARAAADGYTLLLAQSTDVRNSILYKNLKFSFVHDMAPVASIALAMGVLVVHPSFSAKSVPELIAAAKANPGGITVASAGVGTIQHLSWELFRAATGTNMLHVLYRGEAPALTDLLGEQVQIFFATMAGAIEHINAGKLRALAVTSPTRAQVLPDVPTIGEFVSGYEAVGWSGIVAPKDTSATIIKMLNKQINAGFAEPRIKQRLAEMGESPLPYSPTQFSKFINDEYQKWSKVIEAANITL